MTTVHSLLVLGSIVFGLVGFLVCLCWGSFRLLVFLAVVLLLVLSCLFFFWLVSPSVLFFFCCCFAGSFGGLGLFFFWGFQFLLSGLVRVSVWVWVGLVLFFCSCQGFCGSFGFI